MPPPLARRPGSGRRIAPRADPRPRTNTRAACGCDRGARVQRLDRPRRARVRDLLALNVDAGSSLPLDTKAQASTTSRTRKLSPTLYLDAAAISRLGSRRSACAAGRLGLHQRGDVSRRPWNHVEAPVRRRWRHGRRRLPADGDVVARDRPRLRRIRGHRPAQSTASGSRIRAGPGSSGRGGRWLSGPSCLSTLASSVAAFGPAQGRRPLRLDQAARLVVCGRRVGRARHLPARTCTSSGLEPVAAFREPPAASGNSWPPARHIQGEAGAHGGRAACRRGVSQPRQATMNRLMPF